MATKIKKPYLIALAVSLLFSVFMGLSRNPGSQDYLSASVLGGSKLTSSSGSIAAFAKSWSWSRNYDQDGEYGETKILFSGQLPDSVTSAKLTVSGSYSQSSGSALAEVYIKVFPQVTAKDAAHNKGSYWYGDMTNPGEKVGSFYLSYSKSTAQFDVTNYVSDHIESVYFIAVRNRASADIGISGIQMEMTAGNPNYCGDGTCDSDETCSNCSSDCGACKKSDGYSCYSNSECLGGYCVNYRCASDFYYCGDGSCNGNETCSSCYKDCGTCLKKLGETCWVNSNCETGYCVNQKCVEKPYCGNNKCEAPYEVCGGCIDDCGLCPDGSYCSTSSICEGGYCVAGQCKSYKCGDGTCNADKGETCTNCSTDCGACKKSDGYSCYSNSECLGGYCVNSRCTSNPDYCGDGDCNGNETCSNCSKDCGACEVKSYCGDGTCNENENCNNCFVDCSFCKTSTSSDVTSTNGSIAAFAKNWSWSKERNQDGQYGEVKITFPDGVPSGITSAKLTVSGTYSSSYGSAKAYVYISTSRQITPKSSKHNKGKYWYGDDADLGKLLGSFYIKPWATTEEFTLASYINLNQSDTYYIAIKNTGTYDIGISTVKLQLTGEGGNKGIGESCRNADECASGYCINHGCREGVNYCGDGYCNNNETCNTCGQDCGACKKAIGTYCSTDSQCESGYCKSRKCADTDTPTAKYNGQSCDLNTDCASGHCIHDVCRAGKYYAGDGHCDKDEGESCSNSSGDCGACKRNIGAYCSVNSQCESGYCKSRRCAATPEPEDDEDEVQEQTIETKIIERAAPPSSTSSSPANTSPEGNKCDRNSDCIYDAFYCSARTKTCKYKAWYRPPVEQSCSSYSDCDDYSICQSGKCVEMIPIDPNLQRRQIGEDCTSFAQCPINAICSEEGICVELKLKSSSASSGGSPQSKSTKSSSSSGSSSGTSSSSSSSSTANKKLLDYTFTVNGSSSSNTLEVKEGHEITTVMKVENISDITVGVLLGINFSNKYLLDETSYEVKFGPEGGQASVTGALLTKDQTNGEYMLMPPGSVITVTSKATAKKKGLLKIYGHVYSSKDKLNIMTWQHLPADYKTAWNKEVFTRVINIKECSIWDLCF